tara:strand:- start:1291 stop:1404 length:114 start_codon:yes stop_codon:yes gene_type:complete
MFTNQDPKPPLPNPVGVAVIIIFIIFTGALILVTIFK